MELALNLGWVAVAAAMFCLWPRFAARTRPGQQTQNRRMQFVALAVLVLILFPVISVTDDLQALQNPAEADCCLRRVHVVPNTNSVFPPVAALPVPVFAELTFNIVRLANPGRLSAPIVDHPGLASIDNRPPPAS
jgi:hypothetical protein